PLQKNGLFQKILRHGAMLCRQRTNSLLYFVYTLLGINDGKAIFNYMI
ncbi:hypothetical protein PSYMO_36143, partial [Pseudomonas amygdali pv. mori str. 301020]